MKYYEQLIKATIDEDFYSANDVLSSIINEDDSIEYVNNLLLFMENNPNILSYPTWFFNGLKFSICPTNRTLYMLSCYRTGPHICQSNAFPG